MSDLKNLIHYGLDPASVEGISKTKCCLGAHIDGYGHSRNCNGDLSNFADDFLEIKKEYERLVKKCEVLSGALNKIKNLGGYGGNPSEETKITLMNLIANNAGPIASEALAESEAIK